MHVKVPSFAKLNLDLRVLYQRPDNFHELRTVFQTISLKDTLTIEANRSARTHFDLTSSVEIADNLVMRAAKAVLDHLRLNAHVRIVLDKKIPMGAGLGGGSSNAAAVLLTLPALLRKPINPQDLLALAESLGSDVPFFLHGGTAVGLGRGTELFPLPDLRPASALVIATGIHVSTPDAYRALERLPALTSPGNSPILREFQALVWGIKSANLDQLPLKNDFEEAVFRMHPELAAVARKLRRLGGKPVMLTGSGSALFGMFATTAQTHAAALRFPGNSAYPVHFVSRSQYESFWRRSLIAAAPSS